MKHTRRKKSPVTPVLETLYGYHPVLEALRADKRAIKTVFYTKRQSDSRLETIFALAQAGGIPCRQLSADILKKQCGSDKHQGIGAAVSPLPLSDIDSLIDDYINSRGAEILLILDGVQDPNNLGALARTAACFRIAGIIIPKDRAATVTPAVSKASAGAVEHMAIARETNLVRTIEKLKKHNIWIVGADAGARLPLFECDMQGPLALVVGAEDKGLRPLVRQQCDFLVSIPQSDIINSLNASVAGAILMYEAFRQRNRTG